MDDPTCTTEAIVLIQNTDGPEASSTVQPSSCQTNTGQATLQPADYQYVWEDESTLSERNDLAAGIYFVTFTDPADPDCPNVLQLEIEDENVLQTDVVVNQQPDCGQSNGSVTINVVGGSGDYDFSWEGGMATRMNLASGIYNLTVTDNQSATCNAPVTFVLTDDIAPAIISSTGTTNVTCNGDTDGSIDFAIDFSENFAAPADTIFSDGIRIFNNGELPAGQICVVIEDANDCIAGGFCFEITEPDALQLNISATESCQNDGTITGEISGGTAPFVINWQDLTEPTSEINRSDLAAGTYALTVTDANGCTTESSLEVPDCQCTPPEVTSVQTMPAMCEMTNGSVTLQIDNPERYVYTWQPDLGTPNEAGNIRTGLPFGGYQVRVAERTDLACNVVVTALVQSDTDLEINQMITPATCESDNGSAILEPANFTYEWSDDETGNERMNLSADTYFVTITDPDNPDCPQVDEIIITSDNPLAADITVNQQPDCGESNGSVTINVTGGSGDYSYSWESSNNTEVGLAAGTYAVTITDNSASNCELPFIFLLTDAVPEAVVNLTSTNPVSCPGENDGRIEFSLEFSENFTEPADIFITDGNQEFVNGNLGVGDYCLQINDGNDCVAGGICFTIEEPEPIELDIELIQPCESTGTITVNVSGGIEPYTYNWSDLAGEDNPANRTEVNVGDYSLKVTDANGCSLIENNIRLDTCLVCDIFPDDFAFVQTTDCEGTTKFCFDLPAVDVPNYEVTIDNEPYEQGFRRCKFDTLGIYSFITLLNSAGPYDLNSWTINGEAFTSTFQTIPDLVDTMNVIDPFGNWELSEDGLLATGGFSGNAYGALNISNQDGV
ncbi:MAG: SprB repeat-containing protein, partial [Saprospiraceae bacterium]